VGAHLDPKLSAPASGGDAHRRRAGMQAACDVGAVDLGEDRLVLSCRFADVSVQIQ
jgi:hypothetical protein